MCRVIAIANQKGGVGKTTTTSNLGIGLAKQGKRVLLTDADAQGSLTASLGYTEPDRLEVTLAIVMGNLINDEIVEPTDGILHHEEGIDLMPGNIELSGLEVSLVNVMSREQIMREYIGIVKEYYDYILIDCMPSLGMITINAFSCADSILIPVQAAYLPVKGLQQLIKTIGKVKRQINPKPDFEGKVYLETVRCFFSISQEALEKCRYNYEGKDTYAFMMSDKYIMGLYTQCLAARKAVALENIELEGLSEIELGVVKLESVKEVLFQALLLDDVKFEDGEVYAEMCTLFCLS